MSLKKTIRKVLIENNRMRNIIRSIIRDIIIVYKNEDEGDFYLPEYFEDRDEMVYEFIGIPPFNVELILQHGENEIDGEYYRNEETIVVYITYDPEEKESLIYDLIGELNELIAHELRHVKQKSQNMFDLNIDEPEDPLEYYTQPHEIDAQYFGFKRLSRLTNRPFEQVIRKWFNTHKSLHGLSKDEEEIVIDKILNYKR